MPVEDERASVHLDIDVAPDLRRRLELAAAASNLTVRDYVVRTLTQAVTATETADDDAWRRLSAAAFARDWESDADAVYDDLA